MHRNPNGSSGSAIPPRVDPLLTGAYALSGLSEIRTIFGHEINKPESDNAVAKLGYRAEGITGYVYPP